LALERLQPVLIRLAGDRDSKIPTTDAAEDLFHRTLKAGLSVKVSLGNVLTLTPPLTIEEGEEDKALGILETCIGEVG